MSVWTVTLLQMMELLFLVDMMYWSRNTKFYVRYAYHDFCFVSYAPLKMPRHLVLKRDKDVWDSVLFKLHYSVKELQE